MHSELADVYRRVYREPPYLEGEVEVARFGVLFAEHSALPGFAMKTVSADGALVGFAYGVGREAGWWPAHATTSAPDQLDGEPLFYVYELALVPELRGRGQGRALLADLLKDRPERFAVLASRVTSPARRLYDRWGWRKVGEFGSRGVDLLALDLR
ncbi:GNAT family N-acetyltransferase [Amycolatopsis pittospori]|uniref:GNAT family N-acetyltransferase n=1 Tax=Amycolatopsis pittospori TaxID=2749434 RepID=UPI0015F12426|nr:GNAT family N-acetyltransferase [Amycolatopsis pittospori]